MLRLYTLLTLLLLNVALFGQDVRLLNTIHYPASGCGLTSNAVVQVNIANNTSNIVPPNSINIYYTVNGGAPVHQVVSTSLNGNASFLFSFSTLVDISACGPYNFNAWVVLAGDINTSNDATSWTVQNDCPIIPGSVINDVSVCQGSNGGTLSLSGWSNGTITGWESSIDGGTSWSPIANLTPSYAYNNVAQNTQYRVLIDGGLCPDAISGIATITSQAPLIPGVLSGGDSLCENVANGVINLTGNTGAVLNWEYTTNNGLTWITETNTTTTLNYTGLTQSTKYRVLVDGGACPDRYSDTALIYVDPYYPQVALSGGDSVCATNATGFITATLPYGPILSWEFSTNGTTWNALSNTSGILGYSNLTQTTYYRLLTEGGQCPDGVSDTAVIYIQPLPTAPTLGSDASFCVSGITGSLNLTGNTTPVLQWEGSTDNGTTWNPISNTTTTFDYSTQTISTIYRVMMDGVHCPDYYSNTSSIAIDQLPVMGTLDQSGSICQYETTDLTISATIADSMVWQYSTDNGTTWVSIPNSNVLNHTSSPILSDIQYQVLGINGICPPQASNAVSITMMPAPVVDAGADVTIYLGDSASLAAQTGQIGIWMPGSTLTDSTISNPVAFPTVTTNYVYYVIGANTCIGRDTVVVTVLDPDQFEVRNVITMNNDNINDVWYITGIEFFPSTKVKVFNLYGKLLYESDDYKNDWKGESNGKKLPNGTYYYVVQKGGTEEELKGTLTLLGNE